MFHISVYTKKRERERERNCLVDPIGHDGIYVNNIGQCSLDVLLTTCGDCDKRYKTTRLILGGVTLFLTEAGIQVGCLGYSLASLATVPSDLLG